MLVGSPTNANIDCNGGVRQNPSAQTDDSCRTVSRIYSGTGSGRLRADRATGLGEIRVAGR